MVHDLMNFDLCSWSNIFIINIFPASEVSAICGLPLHVCRLIDTRSWHHSIVMNYTVKTAYRLCLSLAVEIVPSPTFAPSNWNIIWKPQVPPRIWSLLWSLAHNYLPTCTRLIKGLLIDDTCVHYKLLAESHIHSFFVCLKAMNC